MSEGNEHNGRRRELTLCKITIPLMCECHVRYEPLDSVADISKR